MISGSFNFRRWSLAPRTSTGLNFDGLRATRIIIQPTSGGDTYLPVAHTCYNLLDLPKYSSKEILQSKFMQAIVNTEGFALV
ncbi:unnamed protein product [Dibothriocephalus latus]|uniref:HECT-type E3 ubiquitin transferase n=1 Tax=Dibothriocephalus latus TaxID=60516 RepID=A0A3P7MYW8_DIBLA|nr:unnamed protein product [Dibothriocephalus latus]